MITKPVVSMEYVVAKLSDYRARRERERLYAEAEEAKRLELRDDPDIIMLKHMLDHHVIPDKD